VLPQQPLLAARAAVPQHGLSSRATLA